MLNGNIGIFMWVALILAVAIWLKHALGRKRPTSVAHRVESSSEPFPYKKAQYLLSATERTFYDTVRLAVGGRYTVFAKVRMIDVLSLPQDAPGYQTAFNKVIQKQLDFVLFAPDSAEPVLVIELDDRSHQRRDRQDRDGFVNDVFKAARISILRVRARSGYNRKELAGFIEQAVSRPGLVTVADCPLAAHSARPSDRPITAPTA